VSEPNGIAVDYTRGDHSLSMNRFPAWADAVLSGEPAMEAIPGMRWQFGLDPYAGNGEPFS
jgi:hypothetical protein